MVFLPPPPEENSNDLSDAEIQTAQNTSSIEDIEKVVRGYKCPQCGNGTFGGIEHALRRRIPSLYWRIRMVCAQDHPIRLIFKVDWLKS